MQSWRSHPHPSFPMQSWRSHPWPSFPLQRWRSRPQSSLRMLRRQKDPRQHPLEGFPSRSQYDDRSSTFSRTTAIPHASRFDFAWPLGWKSSGSSSSSRRLLLKQLR
ncbi:unnamed protein product [Symbiodinium microadriaticum]|nr:unnamed protein product [Symbiodinium microadriaticum]CAE7360304.1 unnamed protein product [Symbiodinium sp. KB8]